MTFDEHTADAALRLARLALAEDLGDLGDMTSEATIPEDLVATVHVVSREEGVVSGLPVVELVCHELTHALTVELLRQDGELLESGMMVARLTGPVRALLTAERTILNFLIHLSGIATRTAAFVARVRDTRAQILDTRKTLPGYRLLHKYAVRCGGGVNHRTGLFDGILIKDNHLAARGNIPVATAVADARSFLETRRLKLPVEIEVDTLSQLSDALQVAPEIVLLDNMTPAQLKHAVKLRDEMSSGTLLEASGGITLETVRGVAETGVDRISVGSLTHSAPALDLGFDWPWQPN